MIALRRSVFTMLVVSLATVNAQQQPVFDVVSIKPSQSLASKSIRVSKGRLDAHNTLKGLMIRAYHIPESGYALDSGNPKILRLLTG